MKGFEQSSLPGWLRADVVVCIMFRRLDPLISFSLFIRGLETLRSYNAELSLHMYFKQGLLTPHRKFEFLFPHQLAGQQFLFGCQIHY